jgi:hypothetical protein
LKIWRQRRRQGGELWHCNDVLEAMDYLRPAEFANLCILRPQPVHFDVMNLFRVDRFIFVPKFWNHHDHIECVDIKINVVWDHTQIKTEMQLDEPAHEFYSPSTIVLRRNVPSASGASNHNRWSAEKHWMGGSYRYRTHLNHLRTTLHFTEAPIARTRTGKCYHFHVEMRVLVLRYLYTPREPSLNLTNVQSQWFWTYRCFLSRSSFLIDPPCDENPACTIAMGSRLGTNQEV